MCGVVDFNEQLRPKHKWNEDAAMLDMDIRALGGITLVNPEKGSAWCWCPNLLPRIIQIRMVVNGKQLGTQLGLDLLAEAGMVFDDGDDSEPTHIQR